VTSEVGRCAACLQGKDFCELACLLVLDWRCGDTRTTRTRACVRGGMPINGEHRRTRFFQKRLN
jgi:hypothetical protein